MAHKENDDRTVHYLHPHFLQEATDTGRISCAEPNIQNLPRVSDSMEMVRRAFRAPGGYLYVTIDYEQIELRVLAHLSCDEKLLGVLHAGGDVHCAIAAMIYHKSPESVSQEERQVGKRLTYGIIYGMGPQAFSKQTGMELEDATRFLSRFRDVFCGVANYMTRIVKHAQEKGHVRTFFHRWRLLPDMNATDPTRRTTAERQAINTVVQGSAADLVKAAMVRVNELILRKCKGDIRVVGQIHDELVFLVPEQGASECVVELQARAVDESSHPWEAALKEENVASSAFPAESVVSPFVITMATEIAVCMEQTMHLKVPLFTKIQIGESLGNMKVFNKTSGELI